MFYCFESTFKESPVNRLLIVIALSISFTGLNGQSTLTDPETGCQFTLPWTCDECTFQWTGECVDNRPEGIGVLTAYYGENEIMHYEGAMLNGLFHGRGIYADEMNNLEGLFENGNFISAISTYQQVGLSMSDTIRFNETEAWEIRTHVTKQIDNVYFTFPASGYAYDHRDEMVAECMEAIQKNCELIGYREFTNFTRITFVTTKEEMLLYSGVYVSGGYNPATRTIHMVVSNEDEDPDLKIDNPPIVHEVMHMISMTAWGSPPADLNWLNEGLATYAENNCSGYTVEEIYRYLMEENRLLTEEDLTRDFYRSDEMVGYHQSGCIAQFLISNYGIEKMKTLWTSGFSYFESIYGMTFSQMTDLLNESLLKKYPEAPSIDWETFMQGC